MTASSATSSSFWTTTSDANAKCLVACGAAVCRPARVAAGRRLPDERLADAVGRAVAQARGCDLPDRARGAAGDLGAVGTVRTAWRRRRDAGELHTAGWCRSRAIAAAPRRVRAVLPGDACHRQHGRLSTVSVREHVAAVGRSHAIAAAACDLCDRDCCELRMVLRPAAAGADARGRVPAMAVLRLPVIPARCAASNYGAQSRTGESIPPRRRGWLDSGSRFASPGMTERE